MRWWLIRTGQEAGSDTLNTSGQLQELLIHTHLLHAGTGATYVPTGFDSAVLLAPGAVTESAGSLGKEGYEACVKPRARCVSVILLCYAK